MTYVFAAAAACTVFVVAGWRGRSSHRATAGNTWTGVPNDPLWPEDETEVPPPGRQADAARAIRMALNRLSPVLAQRSVKLEIAASPGLLVRMEAPVLTDLLQQALTIATERAQASRILVTAAQHGDRVHIGITDDNAATQTDDLQDLKARVALLGGALDIEIRPTEGKTMTLRLATAVEGRENAQIDHLLPELPQVASVH